MSEITLVQEFAASAEQVYAAIADQDGMSAWMGAKISVALRGEGGLVGTVRRIHLGVTSFDERIVEATPPSFLAYQISSPVPLLAHHRGEMRVESLGPKRARLTWHIVLTLKPGFVSPLATGPLGLILKLALKRLARRLEA